MLQVRQKRAEIAIQMHVGEDTGFSQLSTSLLPERHQIPLEIGWRQQTVVDVLTEVDDVHQPAIGNLLIQNIVGIVDRPHGVFHHLRIVCQRVNQVFQTHPHLSQRLIRAFRHPELRFAAVAHKGAALLEVLR